MTQHLSTVGDRIRELRTKRGLTSAALARQATVSRAYLAQVESGKIEKPSAQILYRIASVLGTSVGVLLGAVSVPMDEDVEVPPSLEEFARGVQLSDSDKLMLARIRYRGRQPQTAEDWAWLWDSIRRSVTRDA